MSLRDKIIEVIAGQKPPKTVEINQEGLDWIGFAHKTKKILDIFIDELPEATFGRGDLLKEYGAEQYRQELLNKLKK